MGKTASIFAGGLVTIGIVTALVLPGRQTANVIKAGTTGGSGLFRTVISGK